MITPEARRYSVRELGRRAGVSNESLRLWRIDVEEKWTTVHLFPGIEKHLRFKNAPAGSWTDCLKSQAVARACWAYNPQRSVRRRVPEFIIPAQHGLSGSNVPVFRQITNDSIEFDWDLPLATFFTISRIEELIIQERDQHDRFLACSSIARQNGFLERPIVDEYGLAVEQSIQSLFPNWEPEKRSLQVKLSHDIDMVGVPFQLREALGHIFRRRRPSAGARDLIASFTNWNPSYLALVQDIVSMSAERDLDSAVYWKASPSGPNDSGYDIHHPKIRKLLSRFLKNGVECGVHPGYATFHSRSHLISEIEALRSALGHAELGGRQHYLRWAPETWLDWEACGLSYDSSVGFADRIGFRAGTCVPYRPWILAENREAKLLEIPLIVMDCTPTQYMGLNLEESLAAIAECIEACRVVGGVFTLLWHNTSLIDPTYGDIYQRILDLLAGAGRFDWKAALKESQ